MAREGERFIKEYDTKFSEEYKAEIDALSEEEKNFFNHVITDHGYYRYDYQYPVVIQKQTITKLSDFVKEHYGKAVDIIVPKEFQSDFYYMLDNFNRYQYSDGWYRRSFRSKDYYPFTDRIFSLAYSYYVLGMMNYHTDNIDGFVLCSEEGIYAEVKSQVKYAVNEDDLIAARIDAGDTKVISVIKEMMTSENNTAILTTDVIRAVILSSDAELHDLLCKLLVAARLSEGLRQAICENADCGTAEAFIKIMQTIKENNLGRFSSVKRSVGTWTGLCHYEDPDRLADKILDDIVYVLENRDHAFEYINTTDAVHIYMGLWGLGFYDVYDAMDAVMTLLGMPYRYHPDSEIPAKTKALMGGKKMTDNSVQLLTIGYFCQNLNMEDITDKISLAVLEAYPEDYKIFSMYVNLYPYHSFYAHATSKNSQKFYFDKTLAAKHYDILLNMYSILPKKRVDYPQILYPWHSAAISKSDLLCGMLDTARILEDNDKIDFICDKLTEFESSNRSYALKIISNILKTPKQRATLVNAAADKESYTRHKAVEILEKMELDDNDYIALEKFTKYKTADLRSGIISLLKKRDADGLNHSIIRMLPSKDENVRLAALDLLIYAGTEYQDHDFSQAKEAVSSIASPSEREEILIQEILGGSSAAEVTKENGYGLYDPNAATEPIDFKPDINVIRNYFSVTKEELTEMHLALMKLIDENSEMEFTDDLGEERVLGNFGTLYHRWVGKDKKICEVVPCRELWAKFYRETIRTPQRYWALDLELTKDDPQNLTAESKQIYQKNQKMLFGDIADYNRYEELISKDKRFENSDFISMRRDILSCICSEFEIGVPQEVCQHMAAYLAKELPEEELWLDIQQEERRYSWMALEKKLCWRHFNLVSFLINRLTRDINKDFETNFRLMHELNLKIRELAHYENGDIRYCSSPSELPAVYYIKAYQLGIISEDVVYKTLMEIFGVQKAVGEMNAFMSREVRGRLYEFTTLLAEEGKELDENDMIPEDSKLYQTGKVFAEKLIDKILDVELKRGDSETVFSKAIRQIDRVYGMDRLLEILKAFGNDTISRASYYYGSNMSKKDSLSHLLSVCYPTADDNAEKLAKLLKKSKIKNDRLIEVAMYAPQWIDIIEQYLKIDGMKSGCYYFMAHTADYISQQRQAMIAKYTPLTKEELNGGCFDVKWFREAYDTLGEKTFNKLYKSAKYISSSNMHTRARKYADAALGKMDIAETEATIEDKRNKDLLMSLAIIPSNSKEDILQRYEFIQKFYKESRQFGAQRRASEGSAVQYALKNLAVTAGYSDETRLTLSMETELVQNNGHYFDWNKIGEYDVKINIDAGGKAALKFEKGGKALKSAPAAIKKTEEFIAIKAFCDKLKQQYSRTVKMFELAMEERDTFSFGELKMLCTNPVTKAIVENLVFVSDEGAFISGLITDGVLTDENGQVHELSDDFLLRTAHPYDLYEHKVWAQYQQMFLSLGEKEGRKQPFRQVFRELYVKLPEELDKEKSLMFAGNQIQTKRTVGTLRNRRWVADYEDGLQKIYYKDNVIAGIYAVADWFSPSDIEAPTLECVTFVDRKTYKPLKMKELPDIVYSEVMRDVDLAVSVAHAGGVDPETSHSTVEMRKVILAFNLKVFSITNVKLEKNHAVIDGKHGQYTIHLGSGVIHKTGGHQINVIAVSGGKKSKIFLPFIDEDPKTAEIMTKVLTFAQDEKIKDPYIMEQIRK